MPTISENEFPKVILSEQAEPATPSAGTAKLFLDTSDGILKWKDDAGTVYEIGQEPVVPTRTKVVSVYAPGSGGVADDAPEADEVLTLLQAVSAEVRTRTRRAYEGAATVYEETIDTGGSNVIILPHVPVTDLLHGCPDDLARRAIGRDARVIVAHAQLPATPGDDERVRGHADTITGTSTHPSRPPLAACSRCPP